MEFCHKTGISYLHFVTTHQTARFILYSWIACPYCIHAGLYTYPHTQGFYRYIHSPLFISTRNYFNSSQSWVLCVRVGSWAYFIPTHRIAGFNTPHQNWASYNILGYRVYSLYIIIKIISSSLPPDIPTTYSCVLTTENIQKNFQKTVDILRLIC